jgi:hypothetical protein
MLWAIALLTVDESRLGDRWNRQNFGRCCVASNGARDKRNPDLDDAVASDDQGVECNGILRIPLHRVVGQIAS